MIVAVTFLLFACFVERGYCHVSWTYDGNTGPNNWCSLGYRECCGVNQSPINIQSKTSRLIESSLRFHDKHLPVADCVLSNDGHSVKVKVSEWNMRPSLSFRHLPYHNYILDSFHFHRGADLNHGSEHILDGIAYPLEAHFVYRNSKYSSLEIATNDPEGIVVVAVFYQHENYDNEELEEVVRYLKQVRNPNDRYELEKKLLLCNWIPNLSRNCYYFTYNGSLTTPPCTKALWVIFQTPVSIGIRQLREFQRVTFFESQRQPNSRPVQPYSHPIVYKSKYVWHRFQRYLAK